MLGRMISYHTVDHSILDCGAIGGGRGAIFGRHGRLGVETETREESLRG